MEIISKKKIQMSDSLLIGIILAMTGGFLDAHTYILRGQVFANAQTGNMVLLGLSVAEGNFGKAFQYLIPIIAFSLGILLSIAVKNVYKEHPRIHWRQISIFIELIILFLAGFIPAGRMNEAVNVMVSFVCSMQVESFRTLNGAAYATTMCTGNLRSATEQLYLYRKTGEPGAGKKAFQYYIIILFFILGGMIGMAASLTLGSRALWICSSTLLAVFLLLFKK